MHTICTPSPSLFLSSRLTDKKQLNISINREQTVHIPLTFTTTTKKATASILTVWRWLRCCCWQRAAYNELSYAVRPITQTHIHTRYTLYRCITAGCVDGGSNGHNDVDAGNEDNEAVDNWESNALTVNYAHAHTHTYLESDMSALWFPFSACNNQEQQKQQQQPQLQPQEALSSIRACCLTLLRQI